MRMRLHHFVLLAMLALFLSLGSMAYAAAGQVTSKPATVTTSVQTPANKLQTTDKTTPKPGPIETSVGHMSDVLAETPNGEDNEAYVPLTFEHMVKLYWRFGSLSPDDNASVIEYIRNTECGLFQKYVNDDFKWPEVVNVTREYLRKYARMQSGKISIVQPIALDRYNPAKGWFNLTADSQYLNVSQLEIADYTNGKYNCGTDGRPRTIPLQARVRLASPFSITYLPMEYSFAQDYLKWTEENRQDPIVIKGATHDRYAFVNFQITLNGLSPRKDSENLWQPSIFIGRLDRYDVYADRALTLPLHHWVNDR